MGVGIDDVAASWAARADRGSLSSEDARSLDEWLDSDPRHLGAYARAQAVLAHFDRAKALGEQFDPAQFAMDPALATPRARRRRRVAIAAAASLVIAVAAGLYLKFTPGEFSTERGEVRLVSLSDGTRVTLNTASTVAVRYNDSERRVRLVGGEALFTVAKDPTRPFIVETHGTRVRAVGTSFTVRSLADEAVQVLVREGVVEVTRNAAAAADADGPVRLTANTRAYAMPKASVKVASVSDEEVARELAWREGMISFAGVTLGEAAHEFARYSDVHIVFDDPFLSERTITGLFASNNPLGFARAIATSMNLTVETYPGKVLLKSHL